MVPPESPYSPTSADSSQPLRQCELLTSVIVGRQQYDSLGTSTPAIVFDSYDCALVLSQDCDLDQDHRVRFPIVQDSDRIIPSVLLTMVSTASDVFARVAASNKKKWDRLNIEQNTNPRFHFLQAILPGSDRLNEGLPEFVIDFKRYFTVPTDEVYHRIAVGETQRRCALVSPYLEHLAHRFASYLSRVGLPTDHASA